jgi:hypothetical protein
MGMFWKEPVVPLGRGVPFNVMEDGVSGEAPILFMNTANVTRSQAVSRAPAVV